MNFMNKRLRLIAFILVVAFGLAGWWLGIRGESINETPIAAQPSGKANASSGPKLDFPEPPEILEAMPSASVAPMGAKPAAPISPEDDEALRKAQQALLQERSERKEDSMIAAWEVTMRRPSKIGDQPLTPPDWTIVGVMRRGADQEVILQRGSDPTPRFRKVGETLPGGARIAWIRPDAVGLSLAKRQVIALPLTGR